VQIARADRLPHRWFANANGLQRYRSVGTQPTMCQ
jgi:hypothetical protein